MRSSPFYYSAKEQALIEAEHQLLVQGNPPEVALEMVSEADRQGQFDRAIQARVQDLETEFQQMFEAQVPRAFRGNRIHEVRGMALQELERGMAGQRRMMERLRKECAERHRTALQEQDRLAKEEQSLAAEVAAVEKDGEDGLETKEDEMFPASVQRVGDRGRARRTRQGFNEAVRGADRNQFDNQKLMIQRTFFL